MCGPLRGAICGRRSSSRAGRADLAAAGDARRSRRRRSSAPNHHFGAVGPMTGMTTRSDAACWSSRTARSAIARYCTINEGLGKVMRFGGNDAEVLARLRWLRDVLGPALGEALRATRRHRARSRSSRAASPWATRCISATSPARRCSCARSRRRLARSGRRPTTLAGVLAFIGGNDQFFLNVAMAMGKAITDPARGIADSTIVTAMCRNGTDFGIRVAGTGDRWFTAPVEMPQGLYFPGYSRSRRQSRHGRLGDRRDGRPRRLSRWRRRPRSPVSSAPAASPTRSTTRARWREIAAARNPEWTDSRARLRRRADRHRRAPRRRDRHRARHQHRHRAPQPGVGQVGAGVARAPLGCFDAGAARAGAKGTCAVMAVR